MGTCSAMARVGSLITPFVAQVCRNDYLFYFLKRIWLLQVFSFCVLFPGVAQVISVLDPVNLPLLFSARRHRILDSAHRDIGQGSAGVQSWPGGRRANNHHYPPVVRHSKLLAPRSTRRTDKNRKERIFCQHLGCRFYCGLNPLSDDGWRTTGDNLITGGEW